MFRRKLLLVLGLMLAVLASPSVWAQQFAHPDGTISGDADYTPTGAVTNWQAVGEGSTPDDGTFIETVINPGVIEFSLSDTIANPGVDTGHILKFRSINIANNAKSVTISLYELGALIAESTFEIPKKTNAWTDYTYVIPTGSAAAIGTYNNLRIRISGNGSPPAPVSVSWVELETPDASGTLPPTVTTDAATGISQNQATLGGTVSSDGGGTVTDVGVYWHTAPGAEAGTKASMTLPSPITDPFTGVIGSLSPGTTYYFKAYATNGAGETIATNELSFTTDPATVPTVTTNAATGISQNQATLGGTVSSDGGDTVTDVGVYWHTAPGAEAGTKVSMTIPSPITNPFTGDIVGLSPGTTYYFKAYATNGAGETIATNELSFTTDPATAPTVTTNAATGISQNQATLGGTVSSDGGDTVTDVGVYWHTAPGAEAGTKASMTLPSPITNPFTGVIGSLSPGTTYYFKAYATNGAGETIATNELSFTTTADLPTVTTNAATGISQNQATLGGTVSSDGGDTVTDVGVYWHTAPGAQAGTKASMTLPSPITDPFSGVIGSLSAGTTYYFKAYATNGAGETIATNELSFTTDPGLPTVTTDAATGISQTQATLGGTVSSDGGGTVTDVGVYWHTTPGAEAGTKASMTLPSPITDPFSGDIVGLSSGTTYYFKAYATNGAGETIATNELSFIAADPPTVSTNAATGETENQATLGGTVSSDGGDTVTDVGVYWHTAPGAEAGTKASMTIPSPITNPFTGVIGSLSPGTTYYFKAYATNGVGETIATNELSFLTDTATDTQASNLIFATIAGKSIRMTWTRGSLDGVIVVMRQGAGKVDPPDGSDYTADPDFSPPLPPELLGGPGNYVVYQGPGTSVLVTGLTMSTSYSVSVYEYSGTGPSTTYLAGPVEVTGATTNYAVHNYDNRVDCDDCHNHGSFGARGPELKAICSTCHNPLGLASTKLEFGFEEEPTTAGHTTPTKNIDIDVVDCGMCHELHNLSATNTTESFNDVTGFTQHNKSFLRANVDKYVPTASPPAYLHTDGPGNNPDRAVEGGDDLTATGYCQVCHSLTSNHRSSNTAGSNQLHDGASNDSGIGTEVNCGICHDHNSNFAASGGSCTGCHSSEQGSIPRPIITTQFDRFSSHVTGGSGVLAPEDCEVCHDQTGHPGDQLVGLLDADDGGIIYTQATAGASTLATGEGEKFAPACLSCHDSNGATRLSGGAVDQTPLSPFTGSGAPPIIDATAWADASHNRPVATSGTSPVTCAGGGVNGCHGSGHGSEQIALLAPAAGPNRSPTLFCYECHDSDGPSTFDIQSQFDTGTNFQAVADDGVTLVNQRHDITTADQAYSGGAVTCKNCHRPHEDATEEIVANVVVNNPVGNPDTGAALAVYSIENSYSGDATSFTYYDGTDAYPDLDPTNPLGGTSIPEPDYVEFCLVCHDGTAPAGVTMPGTMPNMADSYRLNDQHGRLEGRNSASRGYLKEPWASAADYAAGSQPGGGSSTYAALNCTLCHGAHGSGNVFNLRTSITVNGQAMTVGGLEAFTDPANCTRQCDDINNALPEFGSTEYFLPVQENLAWGAWCTFCHEPSHGAADGTGCQSGHLHGGGNF